MGTDFGAIVGYNQPMVTNVGYLYPHIVTHTNCSVTIPHVEIQCDTPASVGRDLVYTVTIGGQTGSRTTSLHYAVPVLTNVTVDVIGGEFNPIGGERSIITGDNFGPGGGAVPPSFVRAHYGPRGTELTAAACQVISQTRIDCNTVEGVGK